MEIPIFTPPLVARFMASLFGDSGAEIRLLDAGAGVGSLTAAFVEEICRREVRPRELAVIAYELEPVLVEYLHSTLVECEELCQAYSVQFSGKVLETDFITAGVEMLRGGLFPVERHSFNRAILNPPYKKIKSDSKYRRLLSGIGIETGNLYSAFLALAVDLLEPGGELVAITPRSFCNGPYFKPFRQLFLNAMALRRIHVFESREATFRADDPDMIIHIATSEMDQFVLDRVNVFRHSLSDLGLGVSTGRVVDFRAKDFLRAKPDESTMPLIYPTHFHEGFIHWPKPGGRKSNALALTSRTRPLLLPSGDYVLVKRFSAKEERRRVVAALYDPRQVSAPYVGFENHLNVYHCNNAGLPPALAKGLAVFLNSTLVDSYLRQFNGHTQVNAADLRMLRYPSREDLAALGASVGDEFPSQREIDELMGITPIMDFCRDYYGKQYAPNTRETIRRQTMHQFVDAGLAIPNPDDPGRPVNSPRFCYQIEPTALTLLKTYGTPAWADSLNTYSRSPWASRSLRW